jgi:hypothetical protein
MSQVRRLPHDWSMSRTSCTYLYLSQSPCHPGAGEVVPRVRAVAAVIERQGRYLITQRRSATGLFFGINRSLTALWPDEATTELVQMRSGMQ